MSAIPFVSPFSTADEVRALAARYLQRDERQPIKDAQVFAAGKALVEGNADLFSNLRLIFRWKLESFLRFPWVLTFPEGIDIQLLREPVEFARTIQQDNDASLQEAVQKFDAIKYVGVPVASAFLTAMYPLAFTIIDRQAYKALSKPFRNTVTEYVRYVNFCRNEAKRLGVSLRQHDQALWQRGYELGRNRQRDN